MAFSSNTFLFLFLPLLLAVHFATPRRHRNAVLLLASLVFYVLAVGSLAWVLLLALGWSYAVGRALATREGRRARGLLALGVAGNLGLLGWFKYASFGWREISRLLEASGLPPPGELAAVALPVGISFFVFHGVAYLVDVARREVAPANGLIDFATYLCFFPKLLAGPITRYGAMERDLRDRRVGLDDLFEGVCRFSLGLGKKVVIAGHAGAVADGVFALPRAELTTPLAWLGAIAYSIQILFDFSGYTDMAIGLGRMLGFRLPENFDRPYRAANITDFWRRWHMSMTSWFRDYLYIPLGGNRRGPLRTYANLFLVFVLCGLWHGAGYTFLVWGLFHGVLLAGERFLSDRWGLRPSGAPGTALTLGLVVVGWVFFRAESLGLAVDHLGVMAGIAPGSEAFFTPRFFLTNDRLFFLALGIALAVLPLERLEAERLAPHLREPLRAAGALAVLFYAVAGLAEQGFQPFLYFRF